MPEARVLYTMVSREVRNGPLVPLAEAMRSEAIWASELPDGVVRVRPNAGPTTGRHMLTVPDRYDMANMPGMADVPLPLLAASFRTARDIASYYLETGSGQVDIGWNYSAHDAQKVIASQRNTFHIHTMAYTKNDAVRPLSAKEIREDFSLRAQKTEPLHDVIHDILAHKIFGVLAENPSFQSLLEQVDDYHGAITYRLKDGLRAFDNPLLARFLQAMHRRSQQVYDELLACFVQKDAQGQVVGQSDGERYRPRHRSEREREIANYIRENTDILSDRSKRYLHYLATHILSWEGFLQRENHRREQRGKDVVNQQEAKPLLNRFGAIKNLAYAAVFSIHETDKGQEVLFGFDPAVFSLRGSLQVSRRLVRQFSQRDPNRVYELEALDKAKKDEGQLVAYLHSIAS